MLLILDRNIQYIELLMLNRGTWSHLIVCKQISLGIFKNPESAQEVG